MRYNELFFALLLTLTATASAQEKRATEEKTGAEKTAEVKTNLEKVNVEKSTNEKSGAINPITNSAKESAAKSADGTVKINAGEASGKSAMQDAMKIQSDRVKQLNALTKVIKPIKEHDNRANFFLGDNNMLSVFGGDVVVTSGTVLVLSGNNTAMSLTGDLINGGALTANKNSCVAFVGTTQNFSSISAVNFGKLQKSGGGTLSLLSSCFVDDSLFLINGIIATGTNALDFDNSQDGMVIIGASNASYIDGAASHPYTIAPEQKAFPLGTAGLLRQVSPRVASQMGATRVAARLNTANAITVNANLGSIQGISTERYYELATIGANPAVYDLVSITANTDDGIGNLNPNSTLRIATTRTAAASWTAQPFPASPNTTIGNLPLVLTTNPFGSSETVASGASFFITFGTANSGDNPLPVVLEVFRIESRESGMRLVWRTASEVDARGFVVMKKKFGETAWSQLASYEQTPALRAANRVTGASYSFTDTAPMTLGDKLVYRLDKIDLSGIRGELMELQVDSRFTTGIREFNLQQNFPNPFNPSTTIRYDIKTQSRVRIEAYNTLGQRVAILVDDLQSAGRYTRQFNAANLASGVYFYRITASALKGENFTKTLKMVLVK
jgi:hypothetical protein